MSVRKETYKAIRDRIVAEMPWIRSIDLQKGQMETLSKTYPLPLPCALIEIGAVTWDNYITLSQLGQATISIFVYFDHSGDSLKGSEMENESLKLMDQMDDVFQKISDLSGSAFKRLVRTGDQVVKYRPRMVVFRCDFSTTLVDSINPLMAQLPPAEIFVQLATNE